MESEQIEVVAGKNEHVPRRHIEAIVDTIFDGMTSALGRGERMSSLMDALKFAA